MDIKLREIIEKIGYENISIYDTSFKIEGIRKLVESYYSFSKKNISIGLELANEADRLFSISRQDDFHRAVTKWLIGNIRHEENNIIEARNLYGEAIRLLNDCRDRINRESYKKIYDIDLEDIIKKIESQIQEINNVVLNLKGPQETPERNNFIQESEFEEGIPIDEQKSKKKHLIHITIPVDLQELQSPKLSSKPLRSKELKLLKKYNKAVSERGFNVDEDNFGEIDNGEGIPPLK